MKAVFSVCLCFFACLLRVTSSVGGNDNSWISPVIELVELDYADTCEKRASATWEELIGSKGLNEKMERDKAFGVFAQSSRNDTESVFKDHAAAITDETLKRKLELLMQQGDLLLDTGEWTKLVRFADTAQHNLRFATNYDCGDHNCSLNEFHTRFAAETDEKARDQMKRSWENNLPDMNEYVEQILPLLRNASKGYESIEAYWDSLVEYEGAILKARELWKYIEPLYIRLQKYIALKLKGDEAVGHPLSSLLLRSLVGDDWSNSIESLLPKHPAIYQKVLAELQLKNIGGKKAFEAAAKLLKDLNLGEIKPEIWSESVFNGTCPATLVDWCKPNKLRVVTCKDVSFANYLDAHETAMKIIYKQTMANYSNNTYILREAPRYSAIYEAIPGFLSLIALSPHAIFRNDLFPVDIFNYNGNHHRTVLQLIMALRDLPKLNFYLAADEWRLKVLSGNITPSQAATDWASFRKDFSLLDTSGTELLADPYVVFNKPFIGKFMGLILKYQIYQSFAEEMEDDESDLVLQVAQNSDRLRNIMQQGFTVKWPEMVRDLLAQREYGLEYTGLTDYYRLLDEYLDSHFDPSFRPEDMIDDYYDPPEPETEKPDDVFDLGENPVVAEIPLPNPDENTIETGEKHSKDGPDTTPAPALEVKKQDLNKEPEPPKEESYNIYWWIGIGVALAVIVVLIAIIARKRHNHRKELEKHRRDNSRA